MIIGVSSHCIGRVTKCILFATSLYLGMFLNACTSAPPTPAPTSTPAPTMSATDMAQLGITVDMNRGILTPADVSDLFPSTTYSITQPIGSPDMRGLTVTYPTQVIEHTSAFAQGFSTRIEVYRNVDTASQAFGAATKQQQTPPLDVAQVGDALQAFSGRTLNAEGYEVGSTEFVTLARKQNIVVKITIRTDRPVTTTRLAELTQLVLDRLNP